jgi:hypothetical protein
VTIWLPHKAAAQGSSLHTRFQRPWMRVWGSGSIHNLTLASISGAGQTAAQETVGGKTATAPEERTVPISATLYHLAHTGGAGTDQVRQVSTN